MKEQLTISLNFPQIQQLVRVRIPKSSQASVSRIATFLSDKENHHQPSVIQQMLTQQQYLELEQDSTMTQVNGNTVETEIRLQISSQRRKVVKGCYVCSKALSIQHNIFTATGPQNYCRPKNGIFISTSNGTVSNIKN